MGTRTGVSARASDRACTRQRRAAARGADRAPMNDAAANPLLAPWDTPYRPAAVRAHPRRALRAGVRARDAGPLARSRGDRRPTPTPPTFDNTIAALDRGGRACARIDARVLQPGGVARPRRRCRRSSASWCRGSRRTTARSTSTPRCSRASTRCTGGARRSASTPRRAAARAHPPRLRASPARASPADARRGSARSIERRLATLTTPFRQNVLADEAAYGARAARRARSRRTARVAARRRAGGRAAARRGRRVGDHAVALARRALPHLLGPARPARAGVHAPGRAAASTTARTTTARSRARSSRCATSWRGCTATRPTPTTRWSTGWPARPAAVARAAGAGVGARQGEGALPERDALRRRRARAARHRDRAVGLALLRREGARRAATTSTTAELKPYFALDRMLAAAFDCAQRLFGVALRRRVRTSPPTTPTSASTRCAAATAPLVGLFLSDNFARPTKRGGAWMSVYRAQSRADGDVLPIVVNNNNFAKAPAGEPTLLSADDVRTLFHEFGHGLHGLLSQVTYERLSGTNVLRDFVELPSQIFEHWAFEPEVLQRHARHHAHRRADSRRADRPAATRRGASTRASRPSSTPPARSSTWRCTRSTDPAGVDIAAFERTSWRGSACRARSCCAIGCRTSATCSPATATRPATTSTCGPRCSTPTATRRSSRRAIRSIRRSRRGCCSYVYSAGGTLDPAEAYRAFRGRDPRVEPMLAERGLL